MEYLESDEDFSPKCNICNDRYGKLDLFEENKPVMEAYNMLNNEFIINTGMEKKVFECFENEVSDKKLFLIKMINIFNTIKEFNKDNETIKSSTSQSNSKQDIRRLKKHGCH